MLRKVVRFLFYMENNAVVWKKKANTKKELDDILTPTVKKWFYGRYQKYSKPQLFGVREIHERSNILISAPTGATKTLTGFLSILNELIDDAEKESLQDKVYAVYISPLKALNNDVRKNLTEPLQEINEQVRKDLGIRVAVRTGDTTASEKQKMLKKPPHILITTPESLAIMLASPKFRENFRNVEWTIIDEIHALAENKRGTHLSLSLERLQHLSPGMCRVGLSATVAPLEEVAQYLVGDRSCKIVDIQYLKNLDFKVISPVDNLIETEHSQLHANMYKLIDEQIQKHKTTLVFTNTRAATERVVDHLKTKFPKKYVGNIGAHHGSLSKESRHEIESKLRNGELKAVVCSTSLELGIDIGYIDLVLCLGSPKSVARFLQRAGRSGHKLHETVKARIIVMDRDDLIECSVLVKSALEKKIDRIHIPTLALDVLAQQINGMAIEEVWEEKELFKAIKKSYCYYYLSWSDYQRTLAFLAGEYAELEDRHVYARIWREDGKIGKRGKMTRVIYMTNIGTIPDESFVTVKIGKQTIGKLDEGFVERLKPGDVFVLGGETYLFKYTRGMVAQVSASANRPPTVPSWFSEMLPLSFDLANEIGRLRRLVLERFSAGKKKDEIIKFINEHLYVDDKAANAVYEYFKEQYDFAKILPTDKTILIEYTKDDREEKIIFHTLFGRRVNDCLSRAVAYAISKTKHKDVEVGINDNGFYIVGDKTLNIRNVLKLLKAEKMEKIMDAAIDKSEIYKRRFRHCATRSLMILRNYLGRQKRVGRQQVSAQILMSVLKRLDKDFTILKEAKRECLEDVMDIKNTQLLLENIEKEQIQVKEIQTKIPSPFALNLALQGYTDVLRIEDKQEFLKRMHAQILAKIHGTELESIDSFEYVKRKKEEIQQLKEILREEVKELEEAGYVKAELLRIVEGDRRNIDPKIIEKISENKWPEELSKFMKTVLPELRKSKFSYEEFWEEQEEQKKVEKDNKKLELYEQLDEGARYVKLHPQIRYDIIKLIGGREDIRAETMEWLKSNFIGTVEMCWKDSLVKFIQKKLKEL